MRSELQILCTSRISYKYVCQKLGAWGHLKMLTKITCFDIFLPILAINDTKVINIIVYEPFRSSAGIHAKKIMILTLTVRLEKEE